MVSNTTTASQLSDGFESKLTALIPKIAALIERYHVSGVLINKLSHVYACTWILGVDKCSFASIMEPVPAIPNFGGIPAPNPEAAQQFWTEIASNLPETMSLLGQSIEAMGKNFEVHFFIDPATMNPEQSVVCQWISDDVLKCSHP